jgi:hypothetical protein
MQQEIDWRHWVIAGVVLALLAVAGWKIVNRPAELPRAAAPPGTNARMQDAPEHPQQNPGNPALPTAR